MGGSGLFGQFFPGSVGVLARDGIEREFDTAGDSQLLIDIADIVPNRMFGNLNFLADFAGAHALGKQVQDFRFARSQQVHASARLCDSQGLELCEVLEEEAEILIVGPDLSAVNGSNALGQQTQFIGAAKYASCSATKRVHDQFAVAGGDHHDGCRLRAGQNNALQNVVSGKLAVGQVTIDEGNVRLMFFQLSNGFIGDDGNADHVDILAAAGNLTGKQVCAEHVDISDEDTDPFSG